MPIIFATAWIAMTAWALALSARAVLAPRSRVPRVIWTVGCIANLAHIAAALHIAHRWDFDHAFAEVARRTYDQVGIAWGGGIYFNYALAVLWLIDAAFWWMSAHAYAHRSRVLEAAIQFYFLFMFFNATVVFGLSPHTRVVGLIACVAATMGVLRTLSARRPMESKENHENSKVRKVEQERR